MKVSLNTVKQYIDVELPPVDELVSRINQQLGKVEEVIDLGAKYKDARVVKVVECDKHPNADKLSVCRIDAGTGELITVVCGAPNVRADMWAVWLPPESTVPSTYETEEPFVLGARELRGVMSNGMLASARELGIGDDHDGIVELTDGDLHQGNQLTVGASFAEKLGLDDTIIDIENKMFTHRPDLFGQLGVAREIAGIFGSKFVSPDWYLNEPKFDQADGLELSVFNDATENVPRFMAAAIENVEIKPSPLWLKCALVAMGSKPINNVVDATNYVMLLTAQPTHAYDYDKLRGGTIGARMAQAGEKVSLLNGKTYQLTTDDIVIADGEGAIGLGGVMGGANSEVSNDTKNVVIEVANFNMYVVRKTSMRYGLFTDALTRFNKGQSPLQNPTVTLQLTKIIERLSGGKQASVVFDESGQSVVQAPVDVTADFINQRLGLDLSVDQIKTLLENVELTVDDGLAVKPAFWRTDLELAEDIVEEVGRLYGFGKLPRELPVRSTKPTPKNPSVDGKQQIRRSLSRAGANEVLTYSFVHQQTMMKSSQDPAQAFKLSNALSPDLQYYRLSLTPSLLDKVHANIKAGHGEFALFEIGKGHHIDAIDDGLPREFGRVGLVYANRKSAKGSPYYQAQKLVTNLYRDCLVAGQVSFKKLADFDADKYPPLAQMCAPYEPERSAMVYVDDKFTGVVGEYKMSVAKSFKLPANSAGFELFLSPFGQGGESSYTPLGRFPSTQQDVSLRVDAEVDYEAVYAGAEQVLADQSANLRTELEPLTIYQAEGEAKKTITLRLTVNDPQGTLTDSAVTELVEKIADSLATKLGAERI